MAIPNEPITRKEQYLSNIAGQGTPLPEAPITREEAYLDAIAKQGGGGGTGDGDMKKSVYDSDLSVSSAGGIKPYVSDAISGKVDKVAGKGLSTNDYTNADKDIVDGVTAELTGKQDTISDLAAIRSGASAGATAYQKPQTGIPNTDLASAVQASLDKADTAIQDISGKADKVSNAANGNFAGLDSTGNLTDSGKSSSDFLPSNTPIPTVSVSYTGTASSTGVRKQQITVNNASYDVDGSAYMEQEVTLSTSDTTTITFTNAIIADGKTLILETSLWDLVPDDMVTTEGVCTIALPKWSSAVTIGVKLRVR